MKSSFVHGTALSLLVLVIGCGMFSEPDPVAPVDDTPTPTRPSEPAPPPPLEGTPVVDELVESFGVFVSANAAPGGNGTRMSPFATIAEGITAAKEIGKRVYVCEGTYHEAIAIADGISMVGGLDCSSQKWDLGNARSRIESPSSPAVTASSIAKPTRFERFEVIAPNGGSSIALHTTSAAALTIAKSRIVAGDGGNGADGVEPPAVVENGSIDGKAGYPSGEASAGFAAKGGLGGTSNCGGPSGAIGGSGGLWDTRFDPASNGVRWFIYNDNVFDYGPKSGALGTGSAANGVNGASGRAGIVTPEGFVTGDGTPGTNGSPGRSGNGGSGQAPVASPENKNIWYGVQGSGGGAGGCAGVAGTAGKGGGASIAAFVSGGITFVESELVAKRGGNGGKGTFGAAPTFGGKGGPAVAGIPSTAGADGLSGGVAGISGSGAGGSSIVLVQIGAEPTMENTKLVVGEGGSGVAEMKNGGKTIPASASGPAIQTTSIVE